MRLALLCSIFAPDMLTGFSALFSNRGVTIAVIKSVDVYVMVVKHVHVVLLHENVVCRKNVRFAITMFVLTL